MVTRIQLRRDTAANWTTVNPVLALGEPGFETDTKKAKTGDGVTAWATLPYEPSLEAGKVPEAEIPSRLSVASLDGAYANKPSPIADGQILVWDAATAEFKAVSRTPANTLITGSYAVLNPGATGSSLAFTAGTVYLTPVYLPNALPVSELWTWCVTAVAATTVELGYYTNSASGVFTRKLIFGSVDTATTGAKILAGTWILPAGFLWFAFLPLGGAPVLRGTMSTPAIPPPHQVTSGNTTPFDDVKVLTGPASQTALPASLTSSGPDGGGAPVRFAVKVA